MSLDLFQGPFFLNVFKPSGLTSYDVLRQIKRQWREAGMKDQGIGHVGTLDPFAEGILLIAFNGATRLSQVVHDLLPKTYQAKGLLGIQTLTGDHTGEVKQSESSPYFNEVIATFDANFWQQELNFFLTQDYYQEPPAFSAAKYEGKKLYQWAREGVYIKKTAVKRRVEQLIIQQVQFPLVEFCATVSSGTYIRTLFEDMAAKMGTIGHLVSLNRIKIGENIGQWNQLCWEMNKATKTEAPDLAQWSPGILKIEDLLPISVVELNEKAFSDFFHGRQEPLSDYLMEVISKLPLASSMIFENNEGEKYYWLRFHKTVVGLLSYSATLKVFKTIHLYTQAQLSSNHL